MKRTNYVIFALVLAMFGYITLRERFSLSTGETADRSERVVPGLVRDRLHAIRVVRPDGRYAITASGRDADGDPRFRLTAPITAEADSDLVLSAISAAEWADPVRTLTDVDAAARRRYGLDHPRVSVTFDVANQAFTLALGRDEVRGGGVYAECDGRFFVVASELAQAFDQPAEHFRVKRVGAAMPADPHALVIHSPRGDVRLTHDQAGWRMATPYQALASEGRANVVLAFLHTVAATRFVDEHPTDLGRYGLDAPSLRITAEGASGSVSFSVGAACSGHEGERYARSANGPVVCVSASEIAPLDVDARAYLELRASRTEAGGVTGYDLHDGVRTLSVQDEEGTFHFRLGSQTGAADPEAVEEWLEGIRNARATDVVPVPAGFAPGVRLTVHRNQGRDDDVIRFAREADGTWLGRRGDESLVMRFGASLGERLVVSTTLVRDRALLHEDPSTIEAITITRPDGREVLRRGSEGLLELAEPAGIPTETARSTDLVLRLAGLEAVRFVADSARPEFGLASPRIVVAFDVARTPTERTTHQLRVGASLPDGEPGAYATFDESPAVFVLVGATLELVASPLASRQTLSTESLFIDAIDVRVGAKTVHLARNGAQFTLDGASLEDSRGNAALNAVADLRATSVLGYGLPGATTGLSSPAAAITIHRAAESAEPRVLTILVGATMGVGDEVGIAVRREDLAVNYLVAPASIATLTSLAR